MVKKIVSGGQTGVDRAALDVAIEIGIESGGWIPRGRRAEDGMIPPRYTGLIETDADTYERRTALNVRDSDASLIFTLGALVGGTRLTAQHARALDKACLIVDLESLSRTAAIAQIREWLLQTKPSILNVAGPRASQGSRVAETVASILGEALGDETE